MKKYVVVIMAILLLVGCTQKPVEAPKKEDYTQEFIGDWHGTMRLQGKDIPIEAYLTPQMAEISWTTKEQQKAKFSQITYEEDSISGSIIRDEQAIDVVATLKDNRLEGTYRVGEESYPFTLVRGELVIESKEEPFTVSVKGGELTATLLTPQLPRMPVYIIIGGSGPTTKDGNTEGMGKNNSYLQLAEVLADDNIASIRFDKRGVGENRQLGLAEERMTFVDFIDDVVALVEAAKKEERFSEVNLIGHSEGSLIAFNVAQQQSINRLISLTGAGRPIDEVLLEQLKPRLDPTLMQEAQTIIEKLKQGERVDVVSEPLQILFRPSV
ncbi:MAG TPA: alpha/beta fold hydrolase, partial [Metalysinibacillus sp.]